MTGNPEFEPLAPHIAQGELRKLVHRSVTDHIFRAEQAHALAERIGRHAKEINEAGFGDLFRIMQVSYGDELTLCITKLYERPHGQYPNLSLPVVLKWMEENADVLTIHDRTLVERVLTESGHEPKELTELPAPALTRLLVEHLRSKLPDTGKFKHRRDKQVAHSEEIETPEELRPTWDEARELIEEAKQIAEVIGTAFIQYYYHTDNGDYMLSQDAELPSRQLERLLKRAGIVDDQR